MTQETESISLPAGTPEERITKALAIAVQYGGIDGAHHKDWTIDQMVRALTGCPMVSETFQSLGQTFEAAVQGESPEYTQLVADACSGEDGPNTYNWETGIAP